MGEGLWERAGFGRGVKEGASGSREAPSCWADVIEARLAMAVCREYGNKMCIDSNSEEVPYNRVVT